MLKNSIIYGANASGKSNLIKAIDFAKKFITKPLGLNEQISINRFKLHKDAPKTPSIFEFTIKTEQADYQYGFKITEDRIDSEWLNKIKYKKMISIFERNYSFDLNKYEYKDCFDIKLKNDDDRQYVRFIEKGTNKNRLFLYECIQRNVYSIPEIMDVFYWFTYTLQIIFPDSKYQGFIFHAVTTKNFLDSMNKLIKMCDTGIEDIELVSVDDVKNTVPPEIYNRIVKELNKKNIIIIANQQSLSQYVISKDGNGSISIKQLRIKHKTNGFIEDSYFEMSEESDGTKRLFDLMPLLFKISNIERVYIVDEIERSIHPEIVGAIFKIFNKYSKEESQLITATHETNLLNLDMFREDEIWFIEKSEYGSSSMVSLEEFKKEFYRDKDLEQNYLQGRFGGVPLIGIIESLDLGGDE